MPVCVALGLVLTSFLLVATAFFAVPSLRSKKIPTTSLIKRPAYLEHSDIPPIDHSDFNYIGKKVSEAADKVLAQFMLEQNGNSSSGSYVHDVNTDSLLQVTEAMLYELSDMIGPQRDQELMVLATEISELERNLQVVEKDLDTQRLRMVDDTFKVEELHSKLEDEIQVMMNSIHTFAMGLLENTGRRRKHGLERDRRYATRIIIFRQEHRTAWAIYVLLNVSYSFLEWILTQTKVSITIWRIIT
jgi:hypothetical protein